MGASTVERRFFVDIVVLPGAHAGRCLAERRHAEMGLQLELAEAELRWRRRVGDSV